MLAAMVAFGLMSVQGAMAARLAKKPASSPGMFHPKRIMPKPAPSEDKPFAEHAVVFHISSGDGYRQKLVLNNAQNMLKGVGPDKIQIEIVAYGPGLRLLFNENAQRGRIKSMAASGITFSACANTMRAMGRPKNALNPAAKVVKGGVERIMELQEAGWTYIRP